ncbi:hypothetical protein SUGI_0574570 [Cryptomeria japonica]|nr:hypothetical protein SUGI_0574570 [Cryptomeria japonica]
MVNACVTILVFFLAALSAISLGSAKYEQGTRKTYIIHVKNRTLAYVGSTLNVVYNVSVESPLGVKMSVETKYVKFKTLNEQAKYSVKFENEGTSKAGTVGFGEITWNSINGGKFTLFEVQLS